MISPSVPRYEGSVRFAAGSVVFSGPGRCKGLLASQQYAQMRGCLGRVTTPRRPRPLLGVASVSSEWVGSRACGDTGRWCEGGEPRAPVWLGRALFVVAVVRSWFWISCGSRGRFSDLLQDQSHVTLKTSGKDASLPNPVWLAVSHTGV